MECMSAAITKIRVRKSLGGDLRKSVDSIVEIVAGRENQAFGLGWRQGGKTIFLFLLLAAMKLEQFAETNHVTSLTQ